MKKFNVTVNGKLYQVEVDEVSSNQPSFNYVPAQQVQQEPAPIQQTAIPVQQSPVSAAPVAGEPIFAPMPGTILDVKVSEGQIVKAGDILLILEAMKMENEIVSPQDGVIAKVNSSKGSTVNTGETLITIA
ncbi:Biotin-requiring enzyme [anaerobic digester metagenome]